jgi:DinB superfamily
MKPNDVLVRHLLELLQKGNAHTTFDEAVKGVPIAKAGERPPACPHSPWELLEHLRIAQHDILKFSEGPGWKSPKWPEGYWPKSPKPAGAAEWRQSVSAFRADLGAFGKLLHKRAAGLEEPFAWGDGQTLLREALLIADHNAYHIGQLVLVRRMLGIWPGA